MTSIPYDPSLELGQVITIDKLKDLKKLAELQQPLDFALDALNNVLSTIYSLKNIGHELENIGLDEKDLDKFQDQVDKLEAKVVAAALHYGVTATKVYADVEKEMNKQAQKTISFSIESPLDYGKSKVTQFPLSSDSLEFDVQYVRNEMHEQSSTATSSQTNDSKHEKTRKMTSGQTNDSKHEKRRKMRKYWFSHYYKTPEMTKSTTENNSSTNGSLIKQLEKHSIDGTVVISAKATHKNADIISPFKLDPVKAVAAWNYTYPDDIIDVQPAGIIAAALKDYDAKDSNKNTLNILSGCDKSSSFVGFVHTLKQDDTDNTQSANSMASQMKESFDRTSWSNAASGGMGNSKSFSEIAKKLLSTSYIENHANLVCHGIIPSIVCGEIKGTVKKMAPDAQKIMDQQSAIANASSPNTDSDAEGQVEGGKKGQQFKELNSEYMKNTVTNLTAYQNESNKVIDINSMMTAFEDFVNKAMEGGGGVPTSFYIKKLTKNDIAKSYIRKFYASGLTTADERRRGIIGQSAEDEEGGAE